jgi:NAD(P)H-hydrate epimerase
MKLVKSEEMQRMDAEAIDRIGIPSLELMENAGRGIAESIIAGIALDFDEGCFAIFCGKGNNGGDGFVIGRHLSNAGYEVVFYTLAPKKKLSKDSLAKYEKAEENNLEIILIKNIDQLPVHLEVDFIIDALFGTGFSGAPKGLLADVIKYINNQIQDVIAVDMPSGLNADDGQYEGEVIDAQFTYTLAQPKYGLFVSPGREKSGEVEIVPIGIPNEVVDKFESYNYLITPEYVSSTLPERKPDGHKGTFGKLFLLAGSTGLTGAAVLAAESALRSGCGMTKVGCPKTVQPIIAQSIIESTTMPLPDVAKKGALALRSIGEVRKAIDEHQAVVIGPGLGQHHETKELVIRLLLGLTKPAIVDADGLNALVGELQVLQDTSAELIITPHPGEFQRLSGVDVPDDIHERIEVARKFAIEHQTILVLKGSPTLVAHYDGKVYLNPSGNSGMATGGSGDVLSGIIGSLLAQGMEPIDAARCGVYIHGLAGDMAADDLGERSLIASDMIEYLPDAFSIL